MSVAAAWWPPLPTLIATSPGCFRTDECRPPAPALSVVATPSIGSPTTSMSGWRVPRRTVRRIWYRCPSTGTAKRWWPRRRRPRRRPRLTDGDTMSMATRTDTQSPALHVADRHDLIRVHGARVNNLKDISVELPKRRLTVFTGVSGSGKSSLVFGTIAAESQRLINETYSAFVQGFMPTLARPEVDVLEGLTTAIIVDQERMGANPRSTVGTV